jgi:hypothetical protein
VALMLLSALGLLLPPAILLPLLLLVTSDESRHMLPQM